MNYLDDLANAIHSLISPELLPTGDTRDLFRMYAVLALAKGDRVVAEDVHDAWTAWMSARDPSHSSLRPLAELPPDVQASDRPYLEAVRTVARERHLGRDARRHEAR